ncbi:Butyryl-CoA:acetate CoA-transferase [Paraconexibacter sp. AEG42_29]|uniref:Butyryl-CoA:acetate CoA-transferase n=1 Tax=Paraconexibacter sp. AEG42_29 TaxID=2997339 RepID=A0AAU7AQV4_9ACTN
MPAILDPDAPDLSEWVSAGDGVVAAQCCAEPTALIAALAAIPGVGDGGLSVFAGMSYTDVFARVAEAGVRVVSYGGLGRTGKVPGLEVVPCNYSALPALFAAGRLPGDVVLLQVSPPDSGGRCSFGPAAEYLVDALPHARAVIAEVNERCPRTAGASIAYADLDAVVHTRRELATGRAGEPGEVEAAIAQHVAALVRDGDTLQLGVGTLPEAILRALGGHRDLGLHGGMITDGVLALIGAGVITNARKPRPDRGLTVTGAALGTTALLDALDGRTDIVFRATSETHAPARIAAAGRLATINSALQLDRDGNAGNESAGGRQIGAIGGQGDFLRAAAAAGGSAVVTLPAARIVARLDGPVSVLRADIDWVVTEHGARSLAGLTPSARRAALTELAGRDLDADA